MTGVTDMMVLEAINEPNLEEGLPSFEELWDGIKNQKSIWAEADWKADLYEDDAEDEGMGDDPVLYTRDHIIRVEIEDRYYYLVNHIKKMMSEGMPCWRAMQLPNDPAAVLATDPLGVYWSTEREGAGVYNGAEPGEEFVFEATTPTSGVDWNGTLVAQLEISAYSDEEQEIRFLPGTKIFLRGVHMPDGIYVKVEDWRTT